MKHDITGMIYGIIGLIIILLFIFGGYIYDWIRGKSTVTKDDFVTIFGVIIYFISGQMIDLRKWKKKK